MYYLPVTFAEKMYGRSRFPKPRVFQAALFSLRLDSQCSHGLISLALLCKWWVLGFTSAFPLDCEILSLLWLFSAQDKRTGGKNMGTLLQDPQFPSVSEHCTSLSSSIPLGAPGRMVASSPRGPPCPACHGLHTVSAARSVVLCPQHPEAPLFPPAFSSRKHLLWASRGSIHTYHKDTGSFISPSISYSSTFPSVYPLHVQLSVWSFIGPFIHLAIHPFMHSTISAEF